MEARWNGKDYDAALDFAVPEGVDLDLYEIATLSALLAAYYDYWGKREKMGKLHPEVQFARALCGEFTIEGKMDGLGSMKNRRSVLIEAKTTSDRLDKDSLYWLRLTFNVQVLNYVVEAWELGWDVSEVYYDVTRKPGIKPKTVNDLDENKLKIVIDSNGKRVYGKNGEPRQTADKAKGWYVKSHRETPDEFCDRLWKDACARPEFYFARRLIDVQSDVVEKFKTQRLVLAQTIEHYRAIGEDPEAWPRNVQKDTCQYCAYSSFCLQNITPDIKHPPEGFAIEPFNPELQNEDDNSTETTDESAETAG
jgi:hypothetical protein